MKLTLTFSDENKDLDTNMGEVQVINGKDGISPVVDLTNDDMGVNIKVTDAEGEKTATVLHGKKGDPGYTPQKGKDYFDGEPGKDAVVDATLSVAGNAADAAETGKAIAALNKRIDDEIVAMDALADEIIANQDALIGGTV